jgi:hypothetical protein
VVFMFRPNRGFLKMDGLVASLRSAPYHTTGLAVLSGPRRLFRRHSRSFSPSKTIWIWKLFVFHSQFFDKVELCRTRFFVCYCPVGTRHGFDVEPLLI